jgi:hypothetical protein
LSDALGRTDIIVESIVRKIEKTAQDLAGQNKKLTDLTVGGGEIADISQQKRIQVLLLPSFF